MVALAASRGLADEPLPGTQGSKLTLTSDALTVQLIDAQIAQLELKRATVAGPAVLAGVGSLGFTVGAALFFAASFGGSVPNTIAMIVGLLIAGPSVLPLAIGIVWLIVNFTHNGRIDEAIQDLKDERQVFASVSTLRMPMLRLASF